MSIPARYVFGYIPDIDVEPLDAPMDFAAWFEVYRDGRWHTFDARNNTPRIGRVLIARGRDRVHAFSWDHTARALASCYRRLAEAGTA